ncbi:ABC transporter permease [Spirosoma aerophilum]
MFRNYLKIAIRNLLRRKCYALLNIIGLAVGMTFTLLIGSYVWSELQVNNGLRHAPNQYLIRSKWKQPGLGYEDVTVAPLGKTLKEKYPGLVANYYRFDVLTTAISSGNKHFVREVAQAGDSTMISMFGFTMLYGDARTALKSPNSVVITEENALKYFGKTDVLGQVLNLSNYAGSKQEFVVTGVLKSLPKNSVTYLWDLPVNVFIPFNSLQGRTDADGWMTWNIANYIELKEGVSPDDVQKPIEKILATYAPQSVRENLQPYLTPLKDYYRDFNQGIVRKTIYTLSGIALFILVMASVNFVNSAVANSGSRMKEIGIRKSMGGQKRQLIVQFLAESTVLAMLSMLLSLLFFELARSSFGDIVGRKIDSFWTVSPYFPLVLGLSTLLIGMLAGLYPALILSALPSVDLLKGKLKSVKEGIRFRRFLITAQFSIALLVCCGAVIVSQQVTYLFNKDLGYNKESIVLLSLPRDWTPQGVASMEAIRNELARLPAVKDISITSSSLKGGPAYDLHLYPVGKDSTEAISTSILQTDENFVRTYQIPLLAGRFYTSSARAEHENKLVINESALKALGYRNPESAIGRQLYSQGYRSPLTIVGVTKDFSFRSMKEKIMPTAIGHVNGAGYLFAYFSVKLNAGDLPGSLDSIEKKFHQLLPDAPFDYSFTDEALQQLYQAEIQLKKAAQTAAFLALFIVVLGVLAMVSLSLARRTKEVSIRKVLGASVSGIVLLFMKEFLLAWLIAMLVACPLAYLLMQNWLQTFAYHIDVSLFLFGFISLVFLLLIGLIVSTQSIKAALINPVKSLRSE